MFAWEYRFMGWSTQRWCYWETYRSYFILGVGKVWLHINFLLQVCAHRLQHFSIFLSLKETYRFIKSLRSVCICFCHPTLVNNFKNLLIRLTSVTELHFISSLYNFDLLVATIKLNEGSNEVKEGRATKLKVFKLQYRALKVQYRVFKTCYSGTSPDINLIQTGADTNTKLFNEKPTTKCMSHVTSIKHEC